MLLSLFWSKKINQEYHQSVSHFSSRSGPHLGPNCLQSLSADKSRHEKVFALNIFVKSLTEEAVDGGKR